MEIKLRDYQSDLMNETLLLLKDADRVLSVAPTGAGKSVMIAYLANELSGRTLILTHRREILTQNAAWIKDASILSADVKDISGYIESKVVVAMTQTLWSRIKRFGIDYVGEFDNIILDEVHIDTFQKVVDLYRIRKKIGFTATPISLKTERMEKDGVKFTRPYSLKRDYDKMAQSVSEQDLIEKGYLVQDFNIMLQLPNMDKLVDDSNTPDGYTYDSINEVYANTVAFDMLWEAYQEHCVGKKTLIFNGSTKVSLELYNFLKEKGVNCRVFDSVNDQDLTREETVEWFRNEKDAVLINCNVFTVGFDVDDVEVVMINRKTKSLSLWLQMVGRASRPTDKFYKDKFTCIDLGQNLIEHGMWSKKRDWAEYFKDHPWTKKNKDDMMATWTCKECEHINLAGTVLRDGKIYCGGCGALRETLSEEKKRKDGELVEVNKLLPPRGRQIVNYALKNGLTSNKAFKLTEEKILELFIYYKIDKEFYEANHGAWKVRIAQIFRPIYFAILNSELKGSNRRYQTALAKVYAKIDAFYVVGLI